MSIHFAISDEGKVIKVEYNGEITCEEFIKDFTKKYLNHAISDYELCTFGIKSKILNSPFFIHRKLKDLIQQDDIIRFVLKKEPKESKIIKFKVNDKGKLINVEYNGEMTCDQFIFDFTKKYTNYCSFDKNVYIFKKGGKILNSEKFKNVFIKDLIKDDQIVIFYRN